MFLEIRLGPGLAPIVGVEPVSERDRSEELIVKGLFGRAAEI